MPLFDKIDTKRYNFVFFDNKKTNKEKKNLLLLHIRKSW